MKLGWWIKFYLFLFIIPMLLFASESEQKHEAVKNLCSNLSKQQLTSVQLESLENKSEAETVQILWKYLKKHENKQALLLKRDQFHADLKTVDTANDVRICVGTAYFSILAQSLGTYLYHATQYEYLGGAVFTLFTALLPVAIYSAVYDQRVILITLWKKYFENNFFPNEKSLDQALENPQALQIIAFALSERVFSFKEKIIREKFITSFPIESFLQKPFEQKQKYFKALLEASPMLGLDAFTKDLLEKLIADETFKTQLDPVLLANWHAALKIKSYKMRKLFFRTPSLCNPLLANK